MTEYRPDADEAVERESEAAAAEAGAIGGDNPDPERDEAERPVAEGGGGEAEGFEEAERELGEHASHGDPGPDPTHLAGEPEAERADAHYGEADRAESTEDSEESDAG
jgi:hypothetical protein